MLDTLVPSHYKKWAGKTWREMLVDQKGRSYLSWAAGNMINEAQSAAIKVLAYVEYKGGDEFIKQLQATE